MIFVIYLFIKLIFSKHQGVPLNEDKFFISENHLHRMALHCFILESMACICLETFKMFSPDTYMNTE